MIMMVVMVIVMILYEAPDGNCAWCHRHCHRLPIFSTHLCHHDDDDDEDILDDHDNDILPFPFSQQWLRSQSPFLQDLKP